MSVEGKIVEELVREVVALRSRLEALERVEKKGPLIDADTVDGFHAKQSGTDAHVTATDGSGNLSVDGRLLVKKEVGIGTSTCAAPLDIRSSGTGHQIDMRNNYGRIQIFPGFSDSWAYFEAGNPDWNGQINGLKITGVGAQKLGRLHIHALQVYITDSLGLGVPSPAYRLQLSSDSAAKPTTPTWTVICDERTKRPDSIRPYASGLDLIRQLQPLAFRYNGLAGTPDGEEVVGFLPSQLQEVLPSAVRRVRGKLREEDEEEVEILGVNIGELPFILLNALKEVTDRLERLETLAGLERARRAGPEGKEGEGKNG